MRGLPGFRHNPGVRRLPRPGATGSSPELVSVPRLPGRRSRCGSGHGGTAARDGSGRGVGTSVSCKVTVRALPGWDTPARSRDALRSAARTFPAPPRGATCGVQPQRITGAAKRPCRRPADNAPGAPSRGARKAAASSRHALRVRRESVVSTSEAGTDDAGNVTSWAVEVRVSRTNGQLTRRSSALRKVATCLPPDVQAKRLTQRRNAARQGRLAYPQSGKTGFHSALQTSATACEVVRADMQVRAIFTYLVEVSGTHA